MKYSVVPIVQIRKQRLRVIKELTKRVRDRSKVWLHISALSQSAPYCSQLWFGCYGLHLTCPTGLLIQNTNTQTFGSVLRQYRLTSVNYKLALAIYLYKD